MSHLKTEQDMIRQDICDIQGHIVTIKEDNMVMRQDIANISSDVHDIKQCISFIYGEKVISHAAKPK